MNKAMLVAFVVSLTASGAAEAKIVDGGANYVPPSTALEVDNTREFSAPYDKTWKAVVAHLSDTSFVMDNIDKDSGLITVSFSVSDPSTAVDCGSWTYWVKNLRGRRDYNNEFAAPYAKYEVLQNGTLTTVERTAALSGKFNILVTSSTEQTSRIKVTARYVQSMTFKVTPLAFDSNFNRVGPLTFIESIGFNTGQQGQISGGQSVCRSKGSLESEVLDSVAPFMQAGAEPAA